MKEKNKNKKDEINKIKEIMKEQIELRDNKIKELKKRIELLLSAQIKAQKELIDLKLKISKLKEGKDVFRKKDFNHDV